METTLNSTKFAHRLQKIMDARKLSATAFAEKLEIGRATISHLMSGRNKPSLDFVMKVVSTFPEVDINELLFGHKNTSTLRHARAQTLEQIKNPSSSEQEGITPAKERFRKSGKNTPQKSIERIVIFYDDGTFTNHNPKESSL